jgi:acyl carrier protein
MEKLRFFSELHSALEVKSVPTFDESTSIKALAEYDSMMILGIIAFVDQNFDKTLTAVQLNEINDVKTLMKLIGEENFQ